MKRNIHGNLILKPRIKISLEKTVTIATRNPEGLLHSCVKKPFGMRRAIFLEKKEEEEEARPLFDGNELTPSLKQPPQQHVVVVEPKETRPYECVKTDGHLSLRPTANLLNSSRLLVLQPKNEEDPIPETQPKQIIGTFVKCEMEEEQEQENLVHCHPFQTDLVIKTEPEDEQFVYQENLHDDNEDITIKVEDIDPLVQSDLLSNRRSIEEEERNTDIHLQYSLGDSDGSETTSCVSTNLADDEASSSAQILTVEKPGSIVVCSICSKRFEVISELWRHMKSEHSLINGRKWLSCNKCNRIFTKKYLLENHLKTHLTCNICSKICPNFRVLDIHYKVNHVCKLCGHVFLSGNEMLTHLHDFHKICRICKASFYSTKELEHHINIQHPKCVFCFKSLKKKDLYKSHVQSHLQCPQCNMFFKNMMEKRCHMNVVHKCSICRKNIKGETNEMKLHISLHLTCPICKQKFPNIMLKDQHMKTKHFQCCNIIFRRIEDFRKHSAASHKEIETSVCRILPRRPHIPSFSLIKSI